MLAMASPLTNFIAPSMAPNKWLSRSSPRRSRLRLGLIDVAGAQVVVDRHLLARHRVEAESGGDFGDALATLGDDDELRDRDDQEDDQTDGDVAADHEVAERADDFAGVGLQQDEPRRGDGDREPEQRGDQDHRREGRELDRPLDIEDDQQDEHADG